MKRVIVALIGLALCVQAAVFEADIQHGGVSMGTVTAMQGEDGFYAFSAEWSPNYSIDWVYWEERMPSGGTQLQAWDISNTSPAIWESPWWVVPGDITGQPCWLVDSTHALAYAPAGVFERVDVITPEPGAFGLFGLLGLSVVAFRRRRLLPVVFALFCIAASSPTLLAADDDPIPTEVTTEVTRREDAGFVVRIEMTPVVKAGGTNIASVDKIIVERWAKRRKLVDGVQVGDPKPVKIDERDCTAWFMARTNAATGLPVALSIARDRGSWAQLAYRQSGPAIE